MEEKMVYTNPKMEITKFENADATATAVATSDQVVEQQETPVVSDQVRK